MDSSGLLQSLSRGKDPAKRCRTCRLRVLWRERFHRHTQRDVQADCRSNFAPSRILEQTFRSTDGFSGFALPSRSNEVRRYAEGVLFLGKIQRWAEGKQR